MGSNDHMTMQEQGLDCGITPENSAAALSAAMELVCACLSLATRANVFTIANATGLSPRLVDTLILDLEALGRVRRCADCCWECV